MKKRKYEVKEEETKKEEEEEDEKDEKEGRCNSKSFRNVRSSVCSLLYSSVLWNSFFYSYA